MQCGYTIILHHYCYIIGMMTVSIEHQSLLLIPLDLAKAKGEAPINEFMINLLQTINL